MLSNPKNEFFIHLIAGIPIIGYCIYGILQGIISYSGIIMIISLLVMIIVHYLEFRESELLKQKLEAYENSKITPTSNIIEHTATNVIEKNPNPKVKSPINKTENYISGISKILEEEKVSKEDKRMIHTRNVIDKYTFSKTSLDLSESPEFEGETKEAIIKRNTRSRKNRDLAISVHGSSCVICNFNFDDVYGKEISKGFIHVHHTKPLSKNKAQAPNIITDLVPVCANCHAMIHRTKEGISISKLRKSISVNVCSEPIKSKQ